MERKCITLHDKSPKFHVPVQTSLEWNSAKNKNRPLERSTVLPHFSPGGSDGTSYTVTFLIFCFKSQAKPVDLRKEKVKLAQVWYSTTVSSSEQLSREPKAQLTASHPGVTPNSPLLKPFTVTTASRLTGKAAITSRSGTQRNQNTSVFSSALKQKENHQKTERWSFFSLL